MSEILTLQLIARLAGFVALLQTAELLSLQSWFGADGVWDWRTLRGDYEDSNFVIRTLLDRYLGNLSFKFMLWFRLIVCLFVMARPDFLGISILFLTGFATSARFRGSFNGGSDSMTLLTLISVAVGFVRPASAFYAHSGICMLAAFSILSYTTAGLSKLRNPKWRDGRAFAQLVTQWQGPRARRLPNGFAKFASWTTLAFECLFAFSLTGEAICVGFLTAGVVFHWLNHRTLALNRFFWAWIITYPAILAVARHLAH